jgi:hypothetical protein
MRTLLDLPTTASRVFLNPLISVPASDSAAGTFTGLTPLQTELPIQIEDYRLVASKNAKRSANSIGDKISDIPPGIKEV